MGNEQHRPAATVEIGGDAQKTLEAVLAVLVTGGIVFDPTLDIGDVNLLNADGVKVNPATSENVAALLAAVATAAKQDTLLAAIAKLAGLAVAAIPGDAVSITNTSATIAAANAARRALVITNMSQVAYLTIKLGSTAVAGKGIILSPSPDNAHPGGTCIIDGKDYTGIVTGILSAADATVGNIAISEA